MSGRHRPRTVDLAVRRVVSVKTRAVPAGFPGDDPHDIRNQLQFRLGQHGDGSRINGLLDLLRGQNGVGIAVIATVRIELISHRYFVIKDRSVEGFDIGIGIDGQLHRIDGIKPVLIIKILGTDWKHSRTG